MNGFDNKDQKNDNHYLNLTRAGFEADRPSTEEVPAPETAAGVPVEASESSSPLEAAAVEQAPAASSTPPLSQPLGEATESVYLQQEAAQPEQTPQPESREPLAEEAEQKPAAAATTPEHHSSPPLPLSFDVDGVGGPVLPLPDEPLQPRGTLPWDAPSPLAGPPPHWAREERHTPDSPANTASTTPESGAETGYSGPQQERAAAPEGPSAPRSDYQSAGGTTGDTVHATVPSQREERKEKKRATITITRRAAAAVILVCLLLSSVLGLGGGWLAYSINDDQAAIVADNGEEAEEPASNSRTVVTPAATPSGQGLTYAQVAAQTADSVVEILVSVSSYDPWFGLTTQEGAGSGVIISDDGYIVTNNHVIENANTIGVTLRDGTNYEAQLVATDAKTDVAVLKIEANGLTPATLGDSEALQVGDPATVIGNPLGQLGGSVTCGAISALDREIDLGTSGQSKVMNLLQTDAAINQGNSGGGLFNQYGQLVGIVVAKSGGLNVEGLGFAIPINDVKGVINDLIDYGYARRVQLGIAMVSLTTEQDLLNYRVETPGIYVVRVEDNSNAAQAGLKVGDRLVSLNGTTLESTNDVSRVINACAIGDTMTIVFDRQGAEQTVQVTMKESLPEGSNPI